jgi:hypothetical protein
MSTRHSKNHNLPLTEVSQLIHSESEMDIEGQTLINAEESRENEPTPAQRGTTGLADHTERTPRAAGQEPR